MNKEPKIVIVSPIRDEEDYLEKTINSLVNQTLLPVEWVIVDDGSKDRTPEIIANAAAKYSWIRVIPKEDRGERAVGPGVVEAFYYGYNRIQSSDYDYICKMDGDIEFKPDYFKTLLSYFERDSHLGAASGKPYVYEDGKLVEERHSDEMVAGMINFYKRECFENIGGFVREVHWDGITFHRARMFGWRTRSLRHEDLEFIHLRKMGTSYKGIVTGRMRWGRGQYFMGTSLFYVCAISLYRSFEKPYIVGGFWIFMGYLKALFSPMKRYDDKAFRASLHAWQRERLKIGKRIENIPEPEVSGLYS
ncbi:MAG: glycosyltransferase family A protein [Spirochaetales bacterium]|nr:glycosyltransferase family A protein [Spirochaetales bacterium]